MDRRKVVTISAACLASPLAGGMRTEHNAGRKLSKPFIPQGAKASEAPFGSVISADIVNYSRSAPFVGISGLLKRDAVTEVKEAGFRLIVDIRRPNELGVAKEKDRAKQIRIDYINLPLAADESAWRQVSALSEILKDSTHYPVLLHCVAANRASALWALYRAQQGVHPITAIEEGRALGLKSRERFVRALLNLTEN